MTPQNMEQGSWNPTRKPCGDGSRVVRCLEPPSPLVCRPFSTERLVPHRSAADCYFSHCFSWHCMRTGYFCSLFLLIMREFVNQKVLFPAFSTSSFDLVTLLGRNFSFGMLLTGAPFYGSLIAFSKQVWCFTAPRIAGNSSLRFPIRSARSSHCFWAGKVLCFLLPGLDLFFACLCQWWKSCYCCFKNMKTMYTGIWAYHCYTWWTRRNDARKTLRYHSLSSSMLVNPTLLHVGFVQSIREQRIVHDFEEHIKLK